MTQYDLIRTAGAVLAALLLIFGTKTFIDIKLDQQRAHAPTAGYKLPLPGAKDTASKGAGAGPAAAAFDAAKVTSAIATANADNGRDVFKKCAACHTVDKGGKALQGPNLWGIVGRPKASVAGFGYSEAMKGKGGDWTFESLAQFVNNPKAFVPGNKMAFAGLSAAGDIADLLAFLRANADSPAPLPGK